MEAAAQAGVHRFVYISAHIPNIPGLGACSRLLVYACAFLVQVCWPVCVIDAAHLLPRSSVCVCTNSLCVCVCLCVRVPVCMLVCVLA